jgi:hypothetical protein
MRLLVDWCRAASQAAIQGWNRFWFTPQSPQTLSVMRIAAGSFIFYTMLVWTKNFAGFFLEGGQISETFAVDFHRSVFAWSHFYWISSPRLLWAIHLFALAVAASFTLGWHTRLTSVLTWLLVSSYVHRVPGTLFGLDQVNTLLALYLMIGDAGGAFSLDARRTGSVAPSSVRTNIAIRLIQLHMCIIYFFAAAGKMQGVSWWDGTALWLALSNYEYQSLDMTWTAHWPLLINLATHLTLLWELSYAALIWPRWTRPIMLALAIPVHLGIAFTMGMITFGCIMLVANLAFVPPEWWPRSEP